MHRSRLALVLGSVFAVVAVLLAFQLAFQSSKADEPAYLNPPSVNSGLSFPEITGLKFPR